MKNSPIQIAVIGCGYWGPNLIRNFSQTAGVRISHLCDLDTKRLEHMKALYPHVQAERDYRKILKNPQIDAVAIATPASTHFAIAKAALSHNKDVLVEKPLALRSSHARELVALAKKQRRILMVDHVYVYNSAVGKLREYVQKGELGKILYVHMDRLNLGLFRHDTNVVWDLCPHDLSVLDYVLGTKALSVQASGSSHYYRGKEEVAFAILRYPKNILAHIHVSWIDPSKTRRIVVVGDKKMAIFDDLNDAEPLRIYDKGVVAHPHYESFGEFKLLYNWGDIVIPKVEIGEPLKIECQHFVECVRQRQTPKTDGLAGLRIVNALEAIQTSLRKNGKTVMI